MTQTIPALDIDEFLDCLHEEKKFTVAMQVETELTLNIPFPVRMKKSNSGSSFSFKVDKKHDADLVKMFADIKGRLGKKNHKWNWKALIRIATHPHRQLDAPTDLDEVKLTPKGSISVREPTEDPSTKVIDDWPVIEVCGMIESSSKLNCKRLANRNLHKLCSLMSVVYTAKTIVLEEPMAEEEPFQSKLIECELETIKGNELITYWRNLLTNDCAYRASSLFREGMLLSAKHMSFSHLAYISAIETIGEVIMPTTTCEGLNGDDLVHCPNCNLKKGAIKSFSAGLDLVNDERCERIKNDFYKIRSKLVHSGKLHGGEYLGVKASLELPYSTFVDGHIFNFALAEIRDVVSKMLLSQKFYFEAPVPRLPTSKSPASGPP